MTLRYVFQTSHFVFITGLLLMNLLSCAQVNLNSQVIRGLLIQTKEGTRDLLQKFNPSHKPTVLSVKPLLCAAALRSYFLALEFFSSWELLSKQNPQTSQPKTSCFSEF
ncbi:hypothetical protein KEM48_009751 [Puccinia striiformis f. sp. tritici PST-130]|nr:hypothetical protein KEM48_009751 [Puccinia striiformis f. sp. tritici PST-130]